MDSGILLKQLQTSTAYADRIVHVRRQRRRRARFGNPGWGFSGAVKAFLLSRGVKQLYTHQADALSAVRQGKNVLLATGYGSGKCLSYTLVVMEMLLADPQANALLLFPDPASCRDRYEDFREALRAAGLNRVLAGIYHGDTPAALRARLCREGSVIFSDPATIHARLMPDHTAWRRFLQGLAHLVLDEAHLYRGNWGAHVAQMLRRFFRLCRRYGSDPQVTMGLSPLGRARHLAAQLTGRSMQLVDDDGSPRGRRTYLFWNPPPLRERRRSAVVETEELMTWLIRRQVRTIAYSNSQVTAEMICRHVRARLDAMGPPGARQKIACYDATHPLDERRTIERQLLQGEVLAVSAAAVSGAALDAGGLDAGIFVGYPGTPDAFWRLVARVGRWDSDSLIILVPRDRPPDQYVMSHPEYLFDPLADSLPAPTDDPLVALGHVFELPD